MLGQKLEDAVNQMRAQPSCGSISTELIHDRFHADLPRDGLALVADSSGRITSVQLFADGFQGYNGFRGELPEGVSFRDSRAEVRARLGTPSASGGGGVDPYLGPIRMWDRFDRDAYAMHVQYSEGENSVDLISLMTFDAIPR